MNALIRISRQRSQAALGCCSGAPLGCSGAPLGCCSGLLLWAAALGLLWGCSGPLWGLGQLWAPLELLGLLWGSSGLSAACSGAALLWGPLGLLCSALVPGGFPAKKQPLSKEEGVAQKVTPPQKGRTSIPYTLAFSSVDWGSESSQSGR